MPELLQYKLLSLSTSYLVTLELAWARKSLSDSERVKQCAMQMVKVFGDDKMAKKFKTISLSPRTAS